jgi:biopolymer transport protein ExbD
MNKHVLTGSILLALTISFSGCASAQVLKPADAQVRLSENGRLYVGDTETPVKKLAAQLKKDDIDPKTQITIEIPTNATPQTLTAISSELASSGYRRILFSKPRKATAEKGEDPLLKDLR